MQANVQIPPRPVKTRAAQPQAKLTDKAISAAKVRDKPYKLADGNGLYVLINPTGSKLWRWNYRFHGKGKTMALGAYPAMSLAMVRKRRDQEREKLASSQDPMLVRKVELAARKIAMRHSFQAVAKAWWERWKIVTSERHAAITWRRLERDVLPALGTRAIASIRAPELVLMARAIESRGASDLAKRALQTVNQVLTYAVLEGLTDLNPARDVKPKDVLTLKKTEHLKRIDVRDLPELLRKIESYQGTASTRLAMKLMALTFVRTTELIAAPWSEIDFEAQIWRIPGARMKKGKDHLVPLSKQALDVLRTQQIISGGGRLIFPGERDHEAPMSNNTILKALERMGYKGRMTGHGFRGLASTELHMQGFNHAHIELQLAHQEGNAVSAAYNHALYLPQRREMMQKWADYLDESRMPTLKLVTALAA